MQINGYCGFKAVLKINVVVRLQEKLVIIE